MQGRWFDASARFMAAAERMREALLPSVIAGPGIADLPDFIVGDAIASGEVEVILKGWHQPEGAVHLVTPPGGPRPARRSAGGVFGEAFCEAETK